MFVPKAKLWKENYIIASTFENIKNKLLKGIMSVESLYLKENIDIDNI